ncbi:DUF72 domain-containing protein [Tunturiibacter gelidiferens]|uniref:DUF72 domain-containing protein n=1 Tax=Tunturiibacter gelidiferens TaxID=3069689 RepID=UPI003D9BC828
MPGRVRIGISGWTYKPWRGVFYPKGLAQKKELAYASSLFPTIEINGTFYSLQRPSSFATWAEQTPDDFVFSIKASRYITHMLKLRNAEQALANFFASGLLALGHKLGPILWQFPPNFQFNAAKLEEFFTLLPRDTHAAAVLAQHHDDRLKGRAYTALMRKRLIRHAMEIRHPSFVTPDFISLLRRHNIALVCADTVEWPLLMDVTSDFLYCRLHGSEVLYTSGYSDQALDQWAARIAAWARGGEVTDGDHASPKPARRRTARDVYVYFDNDAKVHAPKDAQALIQRVNQLLTPTNGRTETPHSPTKGTQVTK